VSNRRKTKYWGLGLLAFLLALVCAGQAAYPPENDLSVSKVALDLSGKPIGEVNPGDTFYYNITVKNNGAVEAPDVLVTDKFPYEVDAEPLVYSVYPAAPANFKVNQSGDLVYVRFESIPAGAARYINFTVTAPEEAPTTLYNIVNLRYGNDPNSANNRYTNVTYVPEEGYNQTMAAFSFEELLHNQSQLLFQFEDLLHTIPNNASMNYTFLASFEQLLRSQAALTSDFEDLLTNETSTGWDTEYSADNRSALLWSYEQMLYDQAFLFASFNMKINDSFEDMCGYTATGHSQTGTTELIASFEDLLKRQNKLYKSFNVLLTDVDTDSNEMLQFLDAYETLLRIESNLYMSFYNLLDMKYEQEVCGTDYP